MFARKDKETAKEVAYLIDHLWTDFEKLLNEFDRSHPEISELHSKNDKSADDLAFEKCYETMKKLYEMGREVEKLHFIKQAKQKVDLGVKVRNMLPDAFGPDLIPPIQGQRSAIIVRDIFQPFMEKSSRVKHQEWLKLLCAVGGVHLDKEAEQAKKVAQECEKLVAAMLDTSAPKPLGSTSIIPFSQFSPPATKLTTVHEDSNLPRASK